MYLAHLTVLLHKLPLPTGGLCDGVRVSVWSTKIYAIDSVLRERNLPQNLDVTNSIQAPGGWGLRFRAAPANFLEKCEQKHYLPIIV